MIPSFDGADVRQCEFLSLCPIRGWFQREGLVNFWRDWKDVHWIRVKESRTWKHRMVLRICWITLRRNFEPIEVFRRGRILDDFVYDFERKPGEELRDYDTRFNILLRRFEAVAGQVNPLIKAHVFLRKANLSAEKQSQIVCYEFQPLRDAMITAIPRAGALRGGVPLHRKHPGAYSAQVVEAQDDEDEEEHVLESNEASDDELAAECQEAAAMMTIAKTAQGRSGPSGTVLSKTSVI